eukprot:4010183-Prorocentrum_lima.AAC.1
MVDCVTRDDVCAEKLTNTGTTPLPPVPSWARGSRCFSRLWPRTLLPVPVTPVMKTGLLTSIKCEMT